MDSTVEMIQRIRPELPSGYLQTPMMPKMNPTMVQQPVNVSTIAQMPSALLMGGTGGISGRDGGTGGKGDSVDIWRIVTCERVECNA